MMTNVQSLPDIRELKTEIIGEILKNFGITKTAFFIREMMSQKADYLEINWFAGYVSRKDRERLHDHRGLVI